MRTNGRKMDNLKKVMEAAVSAGIVVPAFNVAYLPMVKAITDTLTETNVYGMVEVSRIDFVKFGAKSIAAVAEEYKRVADPKLVSLHLDHIPVIDEDKLQVDWKSLIAEGISCGYHSVMVDGSRLPLAENIRVVREVVQMAHPKGVLVEAELGSVLGHESGPLPDYEKIFTRKIGFTKPEEAVRFVKETGVDWLSVSVGSIHGAISGLAKDQPKVQAKIDIEYLKRLRDATGIPLVLHGGSGVQKSFVLEAFKNGIAKINVGTEIRQVYEKALAESGNDIETGRKAINRAMKEIICATYQIEGSASRICQQ